MGVGGRGAGAALSWLRDWQRSAGSSSTGSCAYSLGRVVATAADTANRYSVVVAAALVLRCLPQARQKISNLMFVLHVRVR